jgi:peptide chain release factor 3
MSDQSPGTVSNEVARRRTFAIISHPDAGKTTLTEKLLLYCGQIHEAGEVSAKANRRKTVSDWMELEKQRGISVSSSVLQFEYGGLRVNLLDTPGHQDFSEDTYRTLMAADSAVMVIDSAKGVEAQTLKLFDVCRMRGIPIFTFFNKMDREGRNPFELMEEIEQVLKISCVPVTWPVGMGDRFRGVYHLPRRTFYFFTPPEKAGLKALQSELKCEPTSSELLKYIDEDQQKQLVEEIDLIESALGNVSHESFLDGKQTPAIFGSARNSFGIPNFLDFFKDFSPGPQEKPAQPEAVKPSENRFTGFVFKIQANMDKAHRDRVAFLRICSGRFERDMDVKHARLKKTVRLSHSKQFLAQDRQTVNEAFGGDIIGIHDPGNFQIGDTVYTGAHVEFEGIPQFSPESFAKLRLRDPIKRKQMQKGIDQLTEEGLVQKFIQPQVGEQDPILGVVGVLQFDVMMFRLKDEYGVDAVLERLPYTHARWLVLRDPKLQLSDLDLRVPLVKDAHANVVALFKSDWEIGYVQKNAPQSIEWYASSFEASRARVSSPNVEPDRSG